MLAGAAASVSLLLRHWKAIEAWSAEPGPGLQDEAEPLLLQASCQSHKPHLALSTYVFFLLTLESTSRSAGLLSAEVRAVEKSTVLALLITARGNHASENQMST